MIELNKIWMVYKRIWETLQIKLCEKGPTVQCLRNMLTVKGKYSPDTHFPIFLPDFLTYMYQNESKKLLQHSHLCVLCSFQ